MSAIWFPSIYVLAITGLVMFLSSYVLYLMYSYEQWLRSITDKNLVMKEIWSKEFAISGMHCNACIGKIEDALGDLPVKAVSLHPPKVVFKQDVADHEVRRRLKKIASGNYNIASHSEAPSDHSHHIADMGGVAEQKSGIMQFYPLFLIFFGLGVISLKNADGIYDWMINFEAGFFLLFGFFKLLDLRGFQSAYSGYDLLAMRLPIYGYVYPFLEIAIGLMLLFGFYIYYALWAIVFLMGFGAIGVLMALLNKRKILCACLGSVIQLPMTTITLLEDLLMVVMAGAMLLAGVG